MSLAILHVALLTIAGTQPVPTMYVRPPASMYDDATCATTYEEGDGWERSAIGEAADRAPITPSPNLSDVPPAPSRIVSVSACDTRLLALRWREWLGFYTCSSARDLVPCPTLRPLRGTDDPNGHRVKAEVCSDVHHRLLGQTIADDPILKTSATELLPPDFSGELLASAATVLCSEPGEALLRPPRVT